MDLSKGSYVRCKATSRQGVVSEVSKLNEYMYVRWLSHVELPDNTIHHYLEYVCKTDVEGFAPTESNTSLEELRRRVMR